MEREYRFESVVSDPYCLNIIREMQRRVENDTEPANGYTLADVGRLAGEAKVKYGGRIERRSLNRYEKIKPRVDKLLCHGILEKRRRKGRTRYLLNRDFASPVGLIRYTIGNFLTETDRRILSESDPIGVRSAVTEGLILHWMMKAAEATESAEGTSFVSKLLKELEAVKESMKNRITIYGAQSFHSRELRDEPRMFAYHKDVDFEPFLDTLTRVDALFEHTRESLDRICPEGWTVVVHSATSEKERARLSLAEDETVREYADLYLGFHGQFPKWT